MTARRILQDYFFQQSTGLRLPLWSSVMVRQAVSDAWRFLAVAVMVKVVFVAFTVTSYRASLKIR